MRSHLLPAAIGRDIRGNEERVLIGSRHHDGRNYSQSGVWERLLCGAHEALIHDYEDYAIDFVRGFSLTAAERASRTFSRRPVNTDALIRFACSVMWRFHSSGRLEAANIHLPEWEPDLRAVTFDGDLTRAPSVIIGAHDQQLFATNRYAYPPYGTELDGRAGLQFIIHGVIFVVKLDRRPYPNAGALVLDPTAGEVRGLVKHVSAHELEGVRRVVMRMQPSHPLRGGGRP